MSAIRIRPVQPGDAESIARIYAPYVEESAITFELDAPGAGTMRERILAVTARFSWLVAELDGILCGYAYADLYRTRAAYRWAVETTVYVDRDMPRRGIGRALYAPLIEASTAAGFVTALGVIALPNDASVALHEAMGFVHAGTQTGVGYKFDRWHDIGFWQRDLAPRRTDQAEPMRPA